MTVEQATLSPQNLRTQSPALLLLTDCSSLQISDSWFSHRTMAVTIKDNSSGSKLFLWPEKESRW